MKKSIIFLSLLFCFVSLAAQNNDCTRIVGNEECLIAPLLPELISASSYKQAHTVDLINDEDELTYFSSKSEQNPYLDIRLETLKQVNEVEICFNANSNGQGQGQGEGEGFTGHYLTLSEFSFGNASLAELVADDCNYSVFLSQGNNCFIINTEGLLSKYARITRTGFGILTINGVKVCTGLIVENCTNGIDDDFDGLIDCEDDDCQPTIVNSFTMDADLECEEGVITIQANSPTGNLTYFVNGELYQECNGIFLCEIIVPPGTYEIVVTNGLCEVLLDFEIDTFQEEDEDSLCPNGSFENGNFSGWSLEHGEIFDGISPVDDSCESSFFGIQQTGTYSDPFLPGADPLIPPSGNEYFFILGGTDLVGMKDISKATNCFIVTPNNTQFCFSYAMVLDNPDDHDPDEKPYFKWELFVDGVPRSERKITSGESSFFDTVGSKSIRGFDCESIDLSRFIGSEVCMEFEVAECTLGDHGAYAIIDGICQNCSDNSPICDFSIPQEICSGQSLNVSFPQTSNFTNYILRICDNNNNCAESLSIDGFSITNVNIEEIIAGSGVTLECDEEYTLEIELFNGCGNCTSSQQFIYNCTAMQALYDDCIVNCESLELFEIPGSIICDNCDIQWQPAGILINSTTANPTLNTDQFTVNSLYDRTYTVSISDGFCEFTKEVFIGKDPEIEIIYEIEQYHCAYDVYGQIFINSDLFSANDLTLTITDLISGDQRTVPIFELGENLLYNFQVSKSFDTRINISVDLNSDCATFGDCSDGVTLPQVDRTNYSANWAMYKPNIFAPNSSNPENAVARTWFSSGTATNFPCEYQIEYTSISYYKLQVFSEAGSLMFEQEIADTTGKGLKGDEVVWDGTFNGSPALSDVYVLMYTIESCYNGTFPDCTNGNGCNSAWFCANDGNTVIEAWDIVLIY